MKEKNAEKKKYLDRYRRARLSAKELEERIEMFRMDAIMPGQKAADAMPHGSGGDRDLSDYIARYDEYISMLIRKRREAQSIMMEISSAIDELEGEEERQVLLYRYIHLLRWETIAEKMHAAPRTVFCWHGKALEHFRIPDNIALNCS